MSELGVANLRWVNRSFKESTLSCCALYRESIFTFCYCLFKVRTSIAKDHNSWRFLGMHYPSRVKQRNKGEKNLTTYILFISWLSKTASIWDSLCVSEWPLSLVNMIELRWLVSKMCQLLWDKLRSGKQSLGLQHFKGEVKLRRIWWTSLKRPHLCLYYHNNLVDVWSSFF